MRNVGGCKYAHQPAKIEKVGGCNDTGLKEAVSLKPDLAVVSEKQVKQMKPPQNYDVKRERCIAVVVIYAVEEKKLLCKEDRKIDDFFHPLMA